MRVLSLLFSAGLFVGLVVTQGANTTNSSMPSMVQLSPDPDFHFEILRDLADAPYGGADIGEVLTAAAQIVPGNFESYYSVFYSFATRIYATATSINACRFPVSVRDTMFRASTYFRSADFFLHHNWSDPRINSLWIQQATAYNAAIKLLPAPGKRVNLTAAQGFQIPCIWFPAEKQITRRPTLVIGGGYDGGMEELYHQMGKGATERGYNVILYEGPGQATPRREQNIGFIPNWETVVTPVVDYLITLPEVDTDAIGLVGFSFGGYLAARAAAFEHRFAATILIDGVVSYGDIVLNSFPSALDKIFKSGNQTEFDSTIALVYANPATPTEFKWTIDQGLWGFHTESPFNWLTQLQSYTVAGVINQIVGPVFVADGQDDIFDRTGQALQLATALGSRATYHEFYTADGAGEHVAEGAYVMQNQVVLDWWQDVLDGIVTVRNANVTT